MYLVLEVVFSLLVQVIAEHFSDIAEMSHFTSMDTLRLSLWRADLVLEIDLQEIFDAISSTCSLTRFGNSTMPVTIQRHLQEICDYDVHTWNTFHDFLTETADRQP